MEQCKWQLVGMEICKQTSLSILKLRMELVCLNENQLAVNMKIIFCISAEMGSDYVAIAQDIIFNENTSLTQVVYIPIKNDECLENNETFNVKLYSTMDCVNITTGEVTITIDDDDSKLADLIVKSVMIKIFLQVLRSH